MKIMRDLIDKIKEKALEEHIPIIMDDTLEVIDKILTEVKPIRILENCRRKNKYRKSRPFK